MQVRPVASDNSSVVFVSLSSLELVVPRVNRGCFPAHSLDIFYIFPSDDSGISAVMHLVVFMARLGLWTYDPTPTGTEHKFTIEDVGFQYSCRISNSDHREVGIF